MISGHCYYFPFKQYPVVIRIRATNPVIVNLVKIKKKMYSES